MSRLFLGVLFLLTVAGCAQTTSSEALCIASVNVDGVYYSELQEPLDPETIDPGVYRTITRNTGCLDQGESSAGLRSGESNYLAVGTELHQVVGFEPSERLAYFNDELAEWRGLTAAAAVND